MNMFISDESNESVEKIPLEGPTHQASFKAINKTGDVVSYVSYHQIETAYINKDTRDTASPKFAPNDFTARKVIKNLLALKQMRWFVIFLAFIYGVCLFSQRHNAI